MDITAGKASWVAALGLLVLGAYPLGCVPVPTEGPEETLFLPAEVDDVLVSTDVLLTNELAEVVSELDVLKASVSAWRSGEGSRQQASVDFLSAMDAWQELESMQLGPLGSSLSVVGGADLRDAVYSWPDVVNACRVDQETVEEDWDQADFFAVNLVSSFGFDALEHLLFADEVLTCPGQVGIGSEWDGLGAEGLDANRAAYAEALVDQLVVDLQQASAAWDGFGPDFVSAAAYESKTDALNAIFDALFYVEKTVKDRKLAQPLGITGCDEASCPDDVEGQTSGQGARFIAANLRGTRTLFTGGDGPGIVDLLRQQDAELADAMLADLDAAIDLADGIDADLRGLVESDPDQVQALHDAVKKFADPLKNDLATLLLLQVPQEAAGDND